MRVWRLGTVKALAFFYSIKYKAANAKYFFSKRTDFFYSDSTLILKCSTWNTPFLFESYVSREIMEEKIPVDGAMGRN
jgi:hypothetical protein